MKKQQFLLSSGCLLLLFAAPASAASIFNGYAYVSPTTAGTGANWYNLSGSAQSQSLDAADLGDFEDNLWLGGQTGLWSEGNGVQYIKMHYSITGAASVSDSIDYTLQSYSDPNDQWGTDVNGANATDLSKDLIAAHGLAAGDYNIAVWVEGKPNNIASVWDSNGGSNYNANFTVIPESSAALLGALGLLGLLRRRR